MSRVRARRSLLICLFALHAVAGSFVIGSVSAQVPSRLFIRPNGFEVSSELQGRIDFWKLIFTRYGEKQLVFHHREHPNIIYSVLDLAEFHETYSGKERAQKTNMAIDAEYRRIAEMLRRLADAGEASNAAERRLTHLFDELPGRLSSSLREAAEKEQIRYQKGVKELFRDGVIRSGRYLHAMEQVFAKEGLPVELTRLPLVESSFNYTAYSSVGAAGIWQFMRATGKKYMRIDAAIDERRDPIAATRAAALYLGAAYQRLGSWPLAVTSYNHGVTGILRASNETGSKDLGKIIRSYNGSSFGFASKNFYAEFMAALEVEQHAEKYFPGIQRELPWHFDEVRLGSPVTYRELVRFTGGDEGEIEKLNRSLMKPVLSGRVRIPAGMTVRVPQGKGKTLLAAVGRGEILKVDDASTIYRAEGSARGVASAKARLAAEAESAAKTAKTSSKRETPQDVSGRYTVRSGENFGILAKRYDVSVSKLMELNPGVSARKIKAGQKLWVPAASGDAVSPVIQGDKTQRRYTVQSGDSLSRIAKRLGISTARLQELNPKVRGKLHPGQELIAGAK